MAIYQYYLAFIPKIGLEKYFQNIPEKIEIIKNTEYFEAKIDKYWKLAEMPFQNLKTDIDKIIDKASWGNDDEKSYNWKRYTTELDNDAFMAVNNINNRITEFSFRADLGEPNLTFLIQMLDLAKKYEMKVMDRKGNIIEPELTIVKDFIKLSNSYRFIENPENFLDGLHNKTIELE
jgi:hypothetical protein